MIPYISKSRKNGMCNQHGRLWRNQWLRKPPRWNTSHYNRIRLLLPTPWIPCQPKNIYINIFCTSKVRGFCQLCCFWKHICGQKRNILVVLPHLELESPMWRTLKVSKTQVPLFFYIFQYVLQKQRNGQKKSSKANSKDKPRFRKA